MAVERLLPEVVRAPGEAAPAALVCPRAEAWQDCPLLGLTGERSPATAGGDDGPQATRSLAHPLTRAPVPHPDAPSTFLTCCPVCAELHSCFYPEVLRYVSVQLPSAAEAEDVAEDICLNALARFRCQGDPAAFRPFLFRVAKAGVIDHLRRPWVNATGSGREAPELLSPDIGPPVLERMCFWDAFRELPGRTQRLLWLHHLQRLPLQEIARTVGWQPERAKKRLARGREPCPRPPGRRGSRPRACRSRSRLHSCSPDFPALPNALSSRRGPPCVFPFPVSAILRVDAGPELWQHRARVSLPTFPDSRMALSIALGRSTR